MCWHSFNRYDSSQVVCNNISSCRTKDFSLQVGGITAVVVVDSGEEFLKKAGANSDDISSFRERLPLLTHYDDCGKLREVRELVDQNDL